MGNFENYSKDQLIKEIKLLQNKSADFEESEEKYKAMFENAPLSYQSLDENGNFIDVNPTWLKTLGYKREEVIGKWFGDFLRSDFVDHFKKSFPEFKKRGYVNDVQFFMQKKNGEEIYISFEGCIGYTPDGKFKQTYCVFKDITKENEAEKKLRTSEALLNTTQKISKVGGWEYDIAKDKMFWTYQTYIIHDINPEDILDGSTDHIDRGLLYYDEKDRPLINDAFQKCIQKGIAYDFEFPFTTFKGRRIYIKTSAKAVKEKGKIIKVIGNIMDITDYKNTLLALMESEEKFRSVLENIQLVGLMLDKNANIIFANDFLLEITGWKREEIIGKNWFDYFIPKELISEIKTVFKKTIQSGEFPHHHENDILTKEGERLTIKWSYTTHFDQKNNLVVITSIGEDITKRKEIELSLESERNLLSAIFDSVSEGIVVCDENGILTRFNEATRKFHGLPEMPIPADKWADYYNLYLPDGKTPMKKEDVPLFRALNEGEVHNVEMVIKPNKGKTISLIAEGKRLIDDSGKTIGAVVTMHNITDRKVYEKELKESEERYRTLITSMDELVFAFDENKRFTYYHSPDSEQLAVNPKYFLGKKISEVMPAHINDLFEKAFAVGNKEKTSGFEYSLEINGEEKWYFANLSPIIKNETFSGSLVVARNITKIKKAENKLIHSHHLMNYIISHNQSAVAVHDRNMNYIYVSQRYLDVYKVKEKDVIGKTHYEVFPDLPQKWRDVHKKALEGEISSAEDDPYEREDGTVDWTRWECRPWYDSDKSIGGIIVYTEVITERKQVEEELRKHRDRLEELVKGRTEKLEKSLKDVERMNDLFVGREFRMKELKDEIKFLKDKLKK